MGACLSEQCKKVVSKSEITLPIHIKAIKQAEFSNAINGTLVSCTMEDGNYIGNLNLAKQKHGYGQLENQNSIYYGYFHKNKFHGKGLLVQFIPIFQQTISTALQQTTQDPLQVVQKSKSIKDYSWEYFLGQFQHGKPIKGKEVRKSFIYNGQYQNFKRSYGVLQCERLTYRGNFSNNLFEGYGQITFSNGAKYQGDFSQGKICGKGKYDSSKNNDQKKNDTYIGHFKNNKYDGYGAYVWRDGSIYNGTYKQGLKHGYGKIRTAIGSEISSEWIQGVRKCQHADIQGTKRNQNPNQIYKIETQE